MICGVVVVFLIFTDVSDYMVFNKPSGVITPTIQVAKRSWEDYESRKVTIEGKEYNLLVADTPKKQSLGLMNVTKEDLAPYDGMIFIDPVLSIKTFWNKNTIMPLELIWMHDDRVVGKSNLPSINESKEIVTVSSPEPANIVVELPQEK